MRRLIIMRHAKAERGSPSGGDFDRPLTAQGRIDAGLVGKALAEAGLKPDLALVSAAVRTRQTWEEVAKSAPDCQLRLKNSLYNAEEPFLRRAVADEDDASDVLLVIGHNPGVHALAARLLNDSSASAAVVERIDHGFPTAAAAAFVIDETGRAQYDGLFLAKALGGAGD